MNLLITGNDYVLMEGEYQKIKQQFTNQDEMNNEVIFDLNQNSLSQLILECTSLPFFSEYRIIKVINPTFLKYKKIETEEVQNQFINYLKNSSPSTILVILLDDSIKYDDKKEKNTDYYKTVSKLLSIKKTLKMSEKEFPAYVQAQLKAEMIKMDPLTMNYFIARLPISVANLQQEIEKLKNYPGKLTIEVIEQLVCKPPYDMNDVFKFYDALLNKNVDKTFSMWREMKGNIGNVMTTMSTIATQFRFLYQVKYLFEQGNPAEKIATELNVHPYRVKLAIDKANSIKTDQLLRTLADLAKVDADYKMGIMDVNQGFEMFLLKQMQGD